MILIYNKVVPLRLRAAYTDSAKYIVNTQKKIDLN